MAGDNDLMKWLTVFSVLLLGVLCLGSWVSGRTTATGYCNFGYDNQESGKRVGFVLGVLGLKRLYNALRCKLFTPWWLQLDDLCDTAR